MKLSLEVVAFMAVVLLFGSLVLLLKPGMDSGSLFLCAAIPAVVVMQVAEKIIARFAKRRST
jgi:hypothetical protein